MAGGLGRVARLRGLWRLESAVSVVRGSGCIILPVLDSIGEVQPAATYQRPAKCR